jgi:hypothetical protein
LSRVYLKYIVDSCFLFTGLGSRKISHREYQKYQTRKVSWTKKGSPKNDVTTLREWEGQWFCFKSTKFLVKRCVTIGWEGVKYCQKIALRRLCTTPNYMFKEMQSFQILKTAKSEGRLYITGKIQMFGSYTIPLVGSQFHQLFCQYLVKKYIRTWL